MHLGFDKSGYKTVQIFYRAGVARETVRFELADVDYRVGF